MISWVESATYRRSLINCWYFSGVHFGLICGRGLVRKDAVAVRCVFSVALEHVGLFNYVFDCIRL